MVSKYLGSAPFSRVGLETGNNTIFSNWPKGLRTKFNVYKKRKSTSFLPETPLPPKKETRETLRDIENPGVQHLIYFWVFDWITDPLNVMKDSLNKDFH